MPPDKKTPEDPMGLGMDAFINDTSSLVEDKDTSVPKEEAKSDEKPEEKVEEKSEESPSKEETKEDKPKEEPKKEPLKADASERIIKDDATDKPQEKKEKEQKTSPSIDWESTDNPLKSEVEKLNKRLRDTQTWGNQKNQEALSSERKFSTVEKQLTNLHKKFDGTYDEKTDEVPVEIQPEINESLLAEIKGRSQASRLAANEQFGADKVDAYLTKFQELWGQEMQVQQLIYTSEMPVHEAIKAVRSYEFGQKYGTDPDKVVDNIRQEMRKELEPVIREEESKRIIERIDKKEGNSQGLSEVKGTADTSKPAHIEPSLKELFPGPGS